MADNIKAAFKLSCAVQDYAWGKLGLNSEVARLHQANSNDDIDPQKPYAELWMGTHIKSPSKIHGTDETLSNYICKNPSCLGEKVRENFPSNNELPFLFKVLSIQKTLSIQAHPNIALAKKLHNEQPNIYLDANHKPEMAIALTPFEVFIGLRPVIEILGFIKGIPELSSIINNDIVNQLETASNENDKIDSLKKCFLSIYALSEEDIKLKLSKMVENLNKPEHVDQYKIPPEMAALFLRIHDEYPGDIGCFVMFFLNYTNLQPGEAVFLGAGLPHAYISGDCIECMACSDNVIRAGLTPKLKDFNLLFSMMNYQTEPAQSFLFSKEKNVSDPYSCLYNPPVPDFSITAIDIADTIANYEMESLESASIILFIKGEGMLKVENDGFEVFPGSVVFISANTKVFLNNTTSPVCAYRAHCII